MKRTRSFIAFIILIMAVFIIQTNCNKEDRESTKIELKSKYSNISPDSAYRLLTNSELVDSIVVIDVRTKAEYSEGHIDNALNIDYYSKSFKDEISKLNKNKIYIVYCKSGMRSAKSCNIMQEYGFYKIYNIEGGFEAWVNARLPYKK